jgi:hypothetical protein
MDVSDLPDDMMLYSAVFQYSSRLGLLFQSDNHVLWKSQPLDQQSLINTADKRVLSKKARSSTS